MIELERHIEILLLDNDCVIVPELGGFMAYHVEARYDERENLFLPPLRNIGFNPKLKLNDSLLAQSYIEAYGISYPEAVNKISEEVNELKQELDNQGVYTFNDLGSLSLNDSGNYEFSPCEAGILTPHLYGLCSTEIPFDKNVTAASAEWQAHIAQTREEKTKETTETFPAEDKSTPLEEDATPEDRTISIRLSVLRNTVAIAAAIIAFFFITTPLGTSTGNMGALCNMESSQFFKIPSHQPHADQKLVLNQSLQNATSSPSQKAVQPYPSSAPSATSGENTAAQHYFSIVLASQVSQKNAHAFASRLKEKGIENVKVLKRKSGNKVVCGTFVTEADAYNALRKYKKNNDEFKEGWVYRVKDEKSEMPQM